jgi:hypothetical protein
MAKEKNLAAVTSVAAADFLRIVTSAGASVKATAANLAKYVIETYNGSSVAGSSQSVKDALDSLNSKSDVPTSSVGTIVSWSNVRRSGNTVTLAFAIDMTQTVSGFTEIANVPQGFRPPSGQNFQIPYIHDGALDIGQVQVLDTGAIRIPATATSGKRQGFTVTYIV